MAIFFTSDLHFGHNREFLYKPRGFNSINQHDAAIIQNWNATVTNDDIVYILGDLMLNDEVNGLNCIQQLNGIKRFIRGNHDSEKKIELYTQIGIQNLGLAAVITYQKYKFYLSHYPTVTTNFDADTLKKGVINLYGHTHQTTNFFNDNPFMYHVGIDSHNCTPVRIDDIIQECKTKISMQNPQSISSSSMSEQEVIYYN